MTLGYKQHTMIYNRRLVLLQFKFEKHFFEKSDVIGVDQDDDIHDVTFFPLNRTGAEIHQALGSLFSILEVNKIGFQPVSRTCGPGS